MKTIKSIKFAVKYFVYLPLFNQDFKISLWNVLKFKLFYEAKKRVAFFDRFAAHYQFTKLIAEPLSKNEKIIIFVGEKEHPLLKKNDHNKKVIYMSNKYEVLFLLLNIPILITPASFFSNKFKKKTTNLVHSFHSLASIHYIYGDGAFDAYDTFFAVGPYHIEELERTSKIRGWKDKIFFKIGYPKIEALIKDKRNKPLNNDIKTILFAPSWGEFNLLKLHGIDIINKVLKNNYKIIVRPHPHSFEYDKETIEEIKQFALSNTNCILEDSNIVGMESYFNADIMIGDWSGASYEFAFGLLRPVLFIDIPKKLNPNSKEQVEYLPMEVVCREEIGVVSTMDIFEENILKIFDKNINWTTQIETARTKWLYNPTNSIKNSLQSIQELKLHR